MTRLNARRWLAAVALSVSATLPLSAAKGAPPPGPPPSAPSITTINVTPFDCYSGAGCLDPSFGTLGKGTYDVGGVVQFATATAVQPDGRIVVAGMTANATPQLDRRWVIARLMSDGSADTSFGTGGVVNLDFLVATGSTEQARAVAIQPDGKILVGGIASGSGSSSSIVVRFTSSGALDPTFGSGGKAIFTRDILSFSAMLLQPDGRILVAEADSSSANTVFRLNANGAVDTSFGVSGFRQFIGRPAALALQSTGKIVVFGDASGDWYVARLTPSGALDKTFGKQGTTTMDFFGNTDLASFGGLVLAADDSIVVAGSAKTSNADIFGNLAFARLTANGALVSSFGSGGRVVIDVAGNDDRATAVIIQSDGGILFSGNSLLRSGSSSFVLVGRLLSNGTLDLSFGTGGVSATSVQAQNSWESLAFDPGGNITVAGHSYASSATSDIGTYRWMVARYYR